MSHLLLDHRIIVIQPELVRRLGQITDAAVLQQLHYWMPRATAEHDGHRWVYKTYEGWSEEIGISAKQVRSSMKRLEEDGIVLSCQPEAYLRRKWYRIDYEHEIFSDSFSAESELSIRPYGRLEETAGADRIDRQGDSIKEITSETTSSITKEVVTGLTLAKFGEAEMIAQYLADRIEANGSRRPNVTKRWIITIERMIRLDKRDPDQIKRAIDWSQQHDFWSTNILSPDALRKHYDRMSLQAQREKAGGKRTGTAYNSVQEYISSLTDVS